MDSLNAKDKVLPEMTEGERQKMAVKTEKGRKIIAYLKGAEAYETDYIQAIRQL